MKTSVTPCLDSFLHAYMTTALWSSVDENGEPLDDGRSEFDVAEETKAKMRADCVRFFDANWDAIELAIETGEVVCGPDFDAYGRAGHDFWLTRCGHGCGFWDGDWPEPYAKQLTDAARAFGNVDLYVGDDGSIHQSP